MIVLSGSMFAADRGNWFTGGQATTASVASTTAKTAVGSASVTPSTSTTSLLTGTTDVSNVVDSVGPAVVKIETLVKSSSRSSSSTNPNMSDPFSQFFSVTSSGAAVLPEQTVTRSRSQTAVQIPSSLLMESEQALFMNPPVIF